MLVELGLITLGYCLIVRPAYAALCGLLAGKIESDIKLAPRRERVAREIEKLEAKIARDQMWLNKYQQRQQQQAQQQQAQQQQAASQNKRSKAQNSGNSMLPLFSKLTQPQQKAKGHARNNQTYENPVKGRIVQRGRK